MYTVIYKMPPYKPKEAQLFIPCDSTEAKHKGFQLVKDPPGMKGTFWHKKIWR